MPMSGCADLMHPRSRLKADSLGTNELLVRSLLCGLVYVTNGDDILLLRNLRVVYPQHNRQSSHRLAKTALPVLKASLVVLHNKKSFHGIPCTEAAQLFELLLPVRVAAPRGRSSLQTQSCLGSKVRRKVGVSPVSISEKGFTVHCVVHENSETMSKAPSGYVQSSQF